MKDSEKALKAVLQDHFIGHSKRLELLVKLVLGLLHLGSVSYSKLSKVLNPMVKRASNFKRIQRFMKAYSFSQQAYIQLVWSLFVEKGNWVVLSMDRTNWKFVKRNINILMLGISYKGTAIPLVWSLLDKRGNSNTSERIALIDRLLAHLNQQQHKQINCLLMDREFIGKSWFSYLKMQSFHFITRIKVNTLVQKLNSTKARQVKELFKKQHFKALRQERIVWGHSLYLAGQYLGGDEWLILASNRPLSQGKRFYGERWGIEVFFAACKTRGFNFEDTHVTKLERIFNLMFLIALAFVWALKTGEWLIQNGTAIPIKKLQKRRAKLYSIFRLGFDHLQERLLNFLSIHLEIRLSIIIFSRLKVIPLLSENPKRESSSTVPLTWPLPVLIIA